MRLPGLDHWAALREVVERGGVSEAAKSLNVGQPAVTKRLQALEACYGVPLLERRGGRLSLTPAGRKVYALAAETLDRQQALITDLKTTSSGIRQLRLESTFTIGEHLLPRILVGFSERFPEYKIRLSLGYSRAIQTRLVTDLADLALVETAPEHPEILVQKWKEDELILVCGKGHPLASVNEIAVNQLHSLSFALREDSSGLRDSLDQALRTNNIEPLPVAMEVSSSGAIMEILAHNRHVSFLPRFLVDEALAQGELHPIRVSQFKVVRTLWIVRNRASLDHPVADAFIQLLREYV
ncbi:MAG: LysR family transcriptional regulator [Proteobacteria bacterium]|nr:MAG: LysR family transcriptional regulator [Pseudomonadota bacterium]QKK11062.1 MAG: LysR family transcriptional regulator [Pseudomonadota bacterium]